LIPFFSWQSKLVRQAGKAFPGIPDFAEAGIGVLPKLEEFAEILYGLGLLPFLFEDLSII